MPIVITRSANETPALIKTLRSELSELAPEALADAIAHWLRLLPTPAYTKVLSDAGIEFAAVRTLTPEQLVSLTW